MWGKNALSLAAVGLMIFVSVANASWLALASGKQPKKIAARTTNNNKCPTLMDIWRAAASAEGPAVIDVDPAAGCTDLRQVLQESSNIPFIIRMKSGPATLAAFDAAKHEIELNFGFIGDSAAVTAIRARQPNAWAWTWAEARQCHADYAKWGWFTTVPESCKGKTMLVTLDEQWRTPGWPRRAMARLRAAGTRVILAADIAPAGEPIGIATTDHMNNVPVDYDGHLWVDDIAKVSRMIGE